MSHAEQPREISKVPAHEDALLFKTPSVFCNKMYLHLTPVVGRLTFGEVNPAGQVEVRSAVTLSINDLLDLKDLIGRMLEGKTKAVSAAPVEDSHGRP